MMHNLKDYREAKIILPQLEAILRIVNLSIQGLSFYRAYMPVSVMLHTLKEQKIVLEIHRDRYKRIVDMKGKKL